MIRVSRWTTISRNALCVAQRRGFRRAAGENLPRFASGCAKVFCPPPVAGEVGESLLAGRGLSLHDTARSTPHPPGSRRPPRLRGGTQNVRFGGSTINCRTPQKNTVAREGFQALAEFIKRLTYQAVELTRSHVRHTTVGPARVLANAATDKPRDPQHISGR
jgi:hypothetical protein